MKRSETVKAFLGLVEESAKLLPMTEERLKRENDLTQDLLHAIEFERNYRKRCRHVTRLHQNRNERRACKDSIEELVPLVAWADKNKTAVNQLKQALGEIRKVEKYHENRRYRPRVMEEEELEGLEERR